MQLTLPDLEGAPAANSLIDQLQLDVMRLIQMAVLAVVALVLGLFVLRPLFARPPAATPPALQPPAAREQDSSTAQTDGAASAAPNPAARRRVAPIARRHARNEHGHASANR